MDPQDINLDLDWDEIVAWSNSGAPEAKALWGKLSEQERKFYLEALERNMQARGPVENKRQDNSLLGMPPELSAIAGAKSGLMAAGGVTAALKKFFGGKSDDVLERARPLEGAADDVAEQVGRGVQHDFRGPVSVQQKGKLGGADTANLRSQPNVTTKRTVEDVREQVMPRKPHADARDWDHAEYPPDAGEDLEKRLAELLNKKPVRRKK